MDERSEGWKRAAVDLWTTEPSAASDGRGEPGSLDYLEALIEASRSYAPWLGDALGIRKAVGKHVVDIGCGPGAQLARFARAGAREVAGVDLVPGHVEQARSHLEVVGGRGEVLVGDAEQLPFSEERFDLAVSANALQFTPDIDAALSEIVRVLRPGGEARIVLYHRNSAYYWWRMVLGRGILRRRLLRYRSMQAVVAETIPWSTPAARPFIRVVGRRELQRLLVRAGLGEPRVWVRGFSLGHLPPADRLVAVAPGLARLVPIEALDRLVGWYVCATARRPLTT